MITQAQSGLSQSDYNRLLELSAVGSPTCFSIKMQPYIPEFKELTATSYSNGGSNGNDYAILQDGTRIYRQGGTKLEYLNTTSQDTDGETWTNIPDYTHPGDALPDTAPALRIDSGTLYVYVACEGGIKVSSAALSDLTTWSSWAVWQVGAGSGWQWSDNVATASGFASEEHATGELANLFDGDLGNTYHHNGVPHWVKYTFPSPTKIGMVRIHNAWQLSGAKTLTIYAHNASDEYQFGKTWYDVDWSNGYVDFVLQPLGSGPQTWNATQYYIEAVSAWSGTNSVYMSELEMFEHSALSIIPYPNVAISTNERIHVLNHDQAYNQWTFIRYTWNGATWDDNENSHVFSWPYYISHIDAEELDNTYNQDLIVFLSEKTGAPTVSVDGTESVKLMQSARSIWGMTEQGGYYSDPFEIDTLDNLQTYRNIDKLRLTKVNGRFVITVVYTDGTEGFPVSNIRYYISADGYHWSKAQLIPSDAMDQKPTSFVAYGDTLYATQNTKVYKAPLTGLFGYWTNNNIETDLTGSVSGLSINAGQTMQIGFEIEDPAGRFAAIESVRRYALRARIGFHDPENGFAQILVPLPTLYVDSVQKSETNPETRLQVTARDGLALLTDQTTADKPHYWDSHRLTYDNFNETEGESIYGGLSHTATQAGSWKAVDKFLTPVSEEENIAFNTQLTDLENGMVEVVFNQATAMTAGDEKRIIFRAVDAENFMYLQQTYDDTYAKLGYRKNGVDTTLYTFETALSKAAEIEVVQVFFEYGYVWWCAETFALGSTHPFDLYWYDPLNPFTQWTKVDYGTRTHGVNAAKTIDIPSRGSAGMLIKDDPASPITVMTLRGCDFRPPITLETMFKRLGAYAGLRVMDAPNDLDFTHTTPGGGWEFPSNYGIGTASLAIDPDTSTLRLTPENAYAVWTKAFLPRNFLLEMWPTFDTDAEHGWHIGLFPESRVDGGQYDGELIVLDAFQIGVEPGYPDGTWVRVYYPPWANELAYPKRLATTAAPDSGPILRAGVGKLTILFQRSLYGNAHDPEKRLTIIQGNKVLWSYSGNWEIPGDDLYLGFRGMSEFGAISDEGEYRNIRISNLDEVVDYVTIDPGESPWGSISRAIQGRYIKFRVNADDTLAVFRPAPGGACQVFHTDDLLQHDWGIDARDVYAHIQMLGAYIQSDYIDDDLLRRFGHRFKQVNNPYLMTVEECDDFARLVVRQSKENAKRGTATGYLAPCIQPEDIIAIPEKVIVDGWSADFGPSKAVMTINYRTYAYNDQELNEEFTTDEAAPLTSPRTCEPGEGIVVLRDTNERWSIANEALIPNAQTVGMLDPGICSQESFERSAGLAMMCHMEVNTSDSSGAIEGPFMGWSTTQLATSINNLFGLAVNLVVQFGALRWGTQDLYGVSDPFTTNTEYRVAVILRDKGAYIVLDNKIAQIQNSGSEGHLFACAGGLANYRSAPRFYDFRVHQLAGDFASRVATYYNPYPKPQISGAQWTNPDGSFFVQFIVDTLPSSGTMQIIVRGVSTNDCYSIEITSMGILYVKEYVSGSPTILITRNISYFGEVGKLISLKFNDTYKVQCVVDDVYQTQSNFDADQFTTVGTGRYHSAGTDGLLRELEIVPVTLSEEQIAELEWTRSGLA